MTNTSSNASSKTSIHILLQGKGGVGKSLISNVAGVDANLCLLWSPWRPLLCPVFGVCSAPLCEVILPLSLSLNLAAKNAPHASHQLRIQ